MKTSAVGRQLIESFEGLILGAYDDYDDRIVQSGGAVRGTLTIGYGHTTSAGLPKVFIGQRITKAQADVILASDLSKVEAWVNKLVKVSINQNQFDALVSFTFNCGNGALARSAILRKLNAKDYQGAADALLQWTRGNGQVLPGLVRRRKAERALFLKPYTNTTPIAHASAGAATAAGGAIAATHLTHWPWIIGGTIVVASLIWLAVYLINKGKS